MAGVEHPEFGVAGPQRVFALDGGDRMHRVRPAQGGGGHFRQADGPDLPGRHQLAEGADAVLDGDLPVPAMQVVEVDDVGLQALQAIVAGLLDRLGPAVDHPHPVHAGHAALGGQDVFLPAALQGVADQGLVGAEAVERGGVQEAVAEVERAQ